MPQTAMALAGVGGGSPSGQAEGRGHKGIGFPSNEGTLMSLAFLVFAVFLVKVVLQLIYAVQNSQANAAAAAGVRVAQMQIPSPVMPASMGTMMGTMMNMVPAMMPPMMAAMEPAMAMRGRARREAHQTDGLLRITANVMEAIGRARDGLARVGDG
ncbi:uncharacterized protein LOC113203239 [Frankliniella occidentalis]|uniref:Uncharacterized protein LOC113203239 n=1 Tax=Frankliniella occidentalis TaxID=133901 RepID=A0A6J1RZ25_FRAOC|nr:uncharacterized protein LOC113203239 [Frankliniella occidentalis]